jgi:hypothetical protein
LHTSTPPLHSVPSGRLVHEVWLVAALQYVHPVVGLPFVYQLRPM